MSTIRLYGTPLSGHAHKVELFLRLLDLSFEYVEAPAALRQSEDFGRLNPLRQIPVLEDGDLCLADSNAILVYLARRYDAGHRWLPDDPADAARVQRWLSISAGEVRHGPANARAARLFGLQISVDDAHAIAARLLAFMDATLAGRDWLALDRPSLADVACYPYVACAPEGGVDLAPYPAVLAWVARFEALPGVKPMLRSAVPA